MSLSAAARTLPQQPTPTRAPARRLRPVAAPAARRKPRFSYALLAVGGALAIGAAQMALSVAATQDSFVLAELNSQQRALHLEQQALQDQLAGLNSPQALAAKADALGMVVVGSASYLRLSDGATFGTGAGAGWISSVDPKGSGAVANALLTARAAATAATDQAAVDAQTPVTPDLPPPITDGLPSPTTR